MRASCFILCLVSLLLPSFLVAQQAAYIEGRVTDDKDRPVEGVNVVILNNQMVGTSSDREGYYELKVQANKQITVVFSFVGYEKKKFNIELERGERRELNVTFDSDAIQLKEIEVKDQRIRERPSATKVDMKGVERLPTPTGGVEKALQSQALGVSSNNELSSAYSVRGGNYHENLVYINDFQVYRPFLIRSGQQEGLSVINSDLTESVLFSAGGFQPKYGDKMSSVLDIDYKNPSEFRGSASGSLLGGSVHLEGVGFDRRLQYLLGVRYKSNEYLLNSLQTEGSYNPSFLDVQSFITYDFSEEWTVEWLTNYARNRYEFRPQSRETSFGVIDNVLQLTVFFDGQEIDTYDSFTSGLSAINNPTDNLKLKWLTSIYRTQESETFDIIGEYWLDEVETDLGDEDFGQTRRNRGTGGFQEFARNRLTATIASAGHKGFFSKGEHFIEWGLNYKHEIIDDRIKEWDRLDSAGYSLPYSGDKVLLDRVLKTEIDLQSNRFSGYLQDNWYINDTSGVNITGGLRFNYWDLNNEFLVSPRMQLSYRPDWADDIVFTASSGLYQQPPFYRELRDLEGNVNRSLKAQKSYHAVAGADLNFEMWGRDFKFITEVYYKYMWDLVPYEFDNLLIRYFGENAAKGYVAGVDFRLHGEFVKNADSWLSMSIMKTEEDIIGDYYQQYVDDEGEPVDRPDQNQEEVVDTVTKLPGSIPRPTDQRVNFGLFFQDYLPNNENFKMHLNLLFGTGLPFGPPDNQRFRDTLRIPPYRRVDVGFSALLWDRERAENIKPKNPLRFLRSIWVTAEVFNLLGVKNTISYFWVKDVTNRTYAVPNHLTSRRINGKIVLKF